jgi:cytochrome c oxidase assembly protein subunit 15
VRRAPLAGTARLGTVLLMLLGVQILLGGITVLLRLPHLISTAHLVNALLIFAGLLALCRKLSDVDAPARAGGRDTDAARAKAGRLAAAAVGALLVQLALGGYVRHSGAGLACPDFPLCSGDVFPDRWLAVVHWVHRWLGVLLLAHFIHLAAAGRRAGAGRGTALALGLAAVQVALGITTVLLQLSPPIRAAHAAVGYALWGVVVWTTLGILGSGQAAARASREPLGTMARA